MKVRSPKPRRRGAGHARRPGPPLRKRLRHALPTPGRILPVLTLALLIAGLVVLVNGPWLRVARVAWAGQQYTASYELQRATQRLTGAPLLALDAAGLEAQLERLPAVADAHVEASLPDQVQITLSEKQPAFVWQTTVVRLVGAADGTLIGQVALESTLPEALSSLPLVDDQRAASRQIIVGDRIESSMLATALRLAAVDPAQLISTASGFGVQLDDEHGFLLVARDASWQAALGLYRVDAAEDPSHPGDPIEAQLAAIRTLFSIEAEAGVSWIDVRNPGKVYWRP